MNPVIEQLLVQLCITCLQINAQGKWHAHFNISGHTTTVYITVRPADCNYADTEKSTDSVVERIWERYNQDDYDWETPEDNHAICVAALERALAALRPYLQPELQEAAA